MRALEEAVELDVRRPARGGALDGPELRRGGVAARARRVEAPARRNGVCKPLRSPVPRAWCSGRGGGMARACCGSGAREWQQSGAVAARAAWPCPSRRTTWRAGACALRQASRPASACAFLGRPPGTPPGQSGLQGRALPARCAPRMRPHRAAQSGQRAARRRRGAAATTQCYSDAHFSCKPHASR